MRGRRRQVRTAAVLRQMLENPTADHYALDLARAAGFPSWTIYPVLAHLEAAGWVVSWWEGEGDPRRRMYRLTDEGRRPGCTPILQDWVAATQESSRHTPAHWREWNNMEFYTDGFLNNLMRAGMVIGFWVGVTITVLVNVTVACLVGGVVTVVTSALVVWDAHKAWKEYLMREVE